MSLIESTYEFFYNIIASSVDIIYMQWLAWIVYPAILTFALPVGIMISVYISAIFLHIYKWRHHIKDVALLDKWKGAKHFLSVLWNAQGKIWHGYEVEGMEKIPDTGSALIILYHGAIPIDHYYLVANIFLHKNRTIWTVGDRFLFLIPGFKILMDVFRVLPGTVSKGVDLLKSGNLLAIAPGGVREAYFSDEYYKVLWGQRIGFAKIAVEAKVPVIPVFTQNIREAVRAVKAGRSFMRRIYERTRLPIVPLYGVFPVKLKTIIGDAIPYEEGVTPEQLALKVKKGLENLISKNQKIPGNILRGMYERLFPSPADAGKTS